MKLCILAGPPASGKTSRIFKEIASLTESDPLAKVIYMAPEQVTLKAEQALLEAIPSHAMLGAQVLSFKRLAYSVFEETGLGAVTFLDDVGKSMLLEKAARQCEKDLLYYQTSVSKRGFIGLLKVMMTEIIQYKISDEKLEGFERSLKEESILRLKIHDIRLIMEQVRKDLGQTSLPSESLLDLLEERIPKSRELEGAKIYLDGFNGFTPQQYQVLEQLLCKADSVTVALTISPQAYQETFERGIRISDLRLNPFLSVQKTLLKLNDLCSRLGAVQTVTTTEKTYQPEEISHVTEQMILSSPAPWKGRAEHVFSFQAEDPQEEVRQLCHRILYLVRDRGFSYHDINVVCADMDRYSPFIRRQAALYRIPVFLDQKADVSLNPYVQFIEAALSMVTTGFSQESVITLLKTGLTNLTEDQSDQVENRARKENWIGIDRFKNGLASMQEEGNGYPELGQALDTFYQATKGRRTVAEFDRALRDLTVFCHIPQHLSRAAQDLEKDTDELTIQTGRLLLADQYNRIYEQVDRILDQLDLVLGSLVTDFTDYAELLRIGISQCRMGQVPSTMDEVTVADFDRSVLWQSRVVFIIGLNGVSFPKVSSSGSLLTDQERVAVGQKLEMAGSEKEKLMEQYYRLYQDMGKAGRYLYLTSSLNQTDGKAAGLSPIWKAQDKCLGPDHLMDDPAVVSTPDALLMEEGRNLTGTVGSWIMKEPSLKRQTDMILSGKALRDHQEPLTKEAASLIDPSGKSMSVSRLETYAQCPYECFRTYGLRLRPREEARVSRLDDGTILHQLLADAGKELESELTDKEAEKLVDKLIRNQTQEYQLYHTTGQFHYYWNKLKKTAARSFEIVSKQAAQSDFKHTAFEWEFGPGRAGQAVRLHLKNGKDVMLEGKVDRIDLWSEKKDRYIQIVDYKSGQTSFSGQDLYNGIQLQLPIYMEACRRQFKAKPAGFFYFHLTLSPVSALAKDGQLRTKEEIAEEQIKNSNLDGVFTSSVDTVSHMDHSLALGGRQVLNARLTKTGGLYKGNQALDADGFEKIGDLALNRARQLAQYMQKGYIRRSPLEDKESSFCSYCPYKSACPYDRTVRGTVVRPKIGKTGWSDFTEEMLDKPEELYFDADQKGAKR